MHPPTPHHKHTCKDTHTTKVFHIDSTEVIMRITCEKILCNKINQFNIQNILPYKNICTQCVVFCYTHKKIKIVHSAPQRPSKSTGKQPSSHKVLYSNLFLAKI